jgi:hypothetical protein
MTHYVSIDGGWVPIVLIGTLLLIGLWFVFKDKKSATQPQTANAAQPTQTTPPPAGPAAATQPAPQTAPAARSGGGIGKAFSFGIRLVLFVIAGIILLSFGYWVLYANGLGQIATWGISHELDQVFTAPSAMRARHHKEAAVTPQPAPEYSTPTAEDAQAAAAAEEERFSKPIVIPDFDYTDPPEPITFPSSSAPYKPIITVGDEKEIVQLCSTHLFPKDARAEDYPCDGVAPVHVWQPRAKTPEQGQISVTVTFTS